MGNKDWLLNAAAIKVARQCIKLVDEELGIRLTLSHPDFLELLEQYSQLSDSSRLMGAVNELMSYSSRASAVSDKKKVVAINERSGFRSIESSGVLNPGSSSSNAANPSYSQQGSDSSSQPKGRPPQQDNEMVSYNGKNYRRWSEGKEFKGLYRGRPRYA